MTSRRARWGPAGTEVSRFAGEVCLLAGYRSSWLGGACRAGLLFPISGLIVRLCSAWSVGPGDADAAGIAGTASLRMSQALQPE